MWYLITPHSNEKIDKAELTVTSRIELTHTPTDNAEFEAETAFLNAPPSLIENTHRCKCIVCD